MGLTARKNKNLGVLVLMLIVAGACFCYGFLVGRFQFFPYERLVSTGKSASRTVKLLRYGKDGYVNAQMALQKSATVAGPADEKPIETAVLPLAIKSVDLRDGTAVPMGAGALTLASENILLLDRLGKIYRYRNQKLVGLEIPPVPNNIDRYILKSDNSSLDRDTFRTHSMAYDVRRGTLYVSFEKYIGPKTNRFNLAAISLDPETFAARGAWKSIYESGDTNSVENYGLAGGGKLLINGDVLYFAVGDYGIYRAGPGRLDAAQDPRSSFGKIYAYDINSGRVSLKSIGHRNTQGLVVTGNGELINVEHGPQGGDELNVIRDGGNYGWPIATYGTAYGAYTWPLQDKTPRVQLESPLFAFVPSVGTSTILQLRGFNERWDGDLLMGSLKGQSLYRLKLVSGRVVFSEPIWIGHRIRDAVQIGQKIYLLTDDALMLEVSVDTERLRSNVRSVDEAFGGAIAKCMACHHFGETNPTQMAPTLSGLNNRKVAADSFTRYSGALRRVGGTWDAKRLYDFIFDPEKFAPGTAMPKIGLAPQELDGVIDQLTGSAGPANHD